jgi:hypothetical protein
VCLCGRGSCGNSSSTCVCVEFAIASTTLSQCERQVRCVILCSSGNECVMCICVCCVLQVCDVYYAVVLDKKDSIAVQYSSTMG